MNQYQITTENKPTKRNQQVTAEYKDQIMLNRRMDVDPPSTSVGGITSNLKRSNSAPMINILDNNTSFSKDALSPSHLVLGIPRNRRFSASFSPGQYSSSLSFVPSRVIQLKHEEGMDVVYREVSHEKEIQSKLQISQSWEDLTLDETTHINNTPSEAAKRPHSLTDPLHIFTPPIGLCSSPSPTRAGKQWFSPSTSLLRTSSFLSPSPSPTRRSFASRRSQSPVALRPSQFSVKRKYDIEMEQDSIGNSAKKINLGTGTPERVVITHSHSMDPVNSPDQTVPQDIADSMSGSSGSP
ncbi:P2R1A-PPP2R2A-interacting phosphatase regulator 1-like isoform X2 [Tachypleus tridentatus]|uniref:P2R1A-PPP2R2A-interacting phosphatase regulator 1-like isoform X2 n=1 Tax=Tachypleus tridentatus TaxID=6853 RepID=UPI003FD68207